MRKYALLSLFIVVAFTTAAQKLNRTVGERCGTMQRLEARFERRPELKTRFESQRTEFNKAVRQGEYRLSSRAAKGGADGNRVVYTIPVVFHIVAKNPNSVTNAQIQAQLDALNKDYFGVNGDSVKIPSYFKPLFGRSGIQFCLARQTPDGENTTGIERITTTQASFSVDDAVKHASSGGADAWDSDKYLNIWLCILSNNVLGYSTFPNDAAPDEQGVVVDYRTLPGGALIRYNTGKTLTHETGHYFNLYHVWGDDNGACTGTDYVDDTPNQANSTTSCYSGIRTDNCTQGGNGIMYQNYMDYSTDACMVMFTIEQVERMESALAAYRSSLLNSNACEVPVTRNINAKLSSINDAPQRLCTNTFTPSVTIKNLGIQTLKSLTINYRIDDGNLSTINWSGSLAKAASANIALNSLTATTGSHTLTVYVTKPNNSTDEDASDDSLSTTIQYNAPVASVKESFEGTAFPPVAWDVVNPDNSVTWKRVTGIAKTGNASAMMNNFNYDNVGQKDDLRLPNANLSGIDSAFLSFQVAAATYTLPGVRNNDWDTLEVLVSTDCGATYNSLYKKYGSSLITRTTIAANGFVPSANEWRKDSVSLMDYIGYNNVLLAFRNTNGYENNIYLDDINLRTVTVNPNLKSKGFLVTPNPARDIITVQFYPQPSNLKSVQVYTSSGQKIAEIITNGQANNLYNINISNQPAGLYIVRALFTDRVVTRKIIKQ